MDTETVTIRLASQRVNSILNTGNAPPQFFTPGQEIPQEGSMRGHGTYFSTAEAPPVMRASLAGVKESVNKLILVKPIKARYYGEVGDVVVGRITEVQQKRWKVDTNSRLDSILLLSSVNLPGGELRRRSEEDEKMMRKYLCEGDLISAEVQNIHGDGTLSLHTRSLTYGKLGQGVMVKVLPSLVKRCKTHFQKLQYGDHAAVVSLILGNNGFIWIYPTPEVSTEEATGGFVQNLDKKVLKEDREAVARVRNCVLALASSRMLLFDTSILYAYESSLDYTVAKLLEPESMLDIAVKTQARLNLQEDE